MLCLSSPLGYLGQWACWHVAKRLMRRCSSVENSSIATALVQYVVVAIFAWQGLTGVLTTLAGILVFQAVVFLVFGFETKGRSLEDASAVTDAEAARQSPMARRPADLGA